MNKLLIATLSFGALTLGAANAADLRAPVKAPVAVAPACAQFGGFYAGVNGGWAYHETHWVDRDAWADEFNTDWALGTVRTTRNGGTAGGQVGYNWQRRCTVFGIEIDGNWAGVKSSKLYSPSAAANDTDLTLEHKVKWFGTARTRAGIIVDDIMLYATGGFAYANIQHTWSMVDTANGNESYSAQKSRWGWVGGVGTEWAINANWSFKAETLYIRFTERTTSVASPAAAQTVSFDLQDSMIISRVGLNYRWGAGR